MVFSLIIIVLVGLAAYFHYLQGFFSAGLSAVMALVAALLAFGYYEVVAISVLKGAMGDGALAISLVGIFAITYLLQRTLFDQFIPGNLRFPLIVEKAGAGVAGLFAGVIAGGVLAVAAQTLPFGASVGGHERYPIVYNIGVPIQIPGKYNIQDSVFDELSQEKFLNDEATKLLFPVDDIVLGLVSHVSGENGSVSNGLPFTSVHPNYLQELFGQRVGLQAGSKFTAINASGKEYVTVRGIYYHGSGPLPQQDPERWEVGDKDKTAIGIRHKTRSSPVEPDKVDPQRRPKPNHVFLVVRTGFNKEIADAKTVNVSFSPSAVRVVANGKNYFPVGVLAGGQVLHVQHPDDYLFAEPTKMVDFVFEMEENAIFAGGEAGAARRISNGVFFEFKRLARVALEGKDATTPIEPPAPDTVEVLRKEGSPTIGSAATQLAKGPVSIEGAPKVSDQLPSKLNVGTASPNETGTALWGAFTLKDKKFLKIEADPTETVQRMAMGPENQLVSALLVPDGMKMVQVAAKPQGGLWGWADNIPELTLLDASGKRHTPAGVIVKATNVDAQQLLMVRYEAGRPAGPMAAPSDARPVDIILLYHVPPNTELKSFDFRGQAIAPVTLKVQ